MQEITDFAKSIGFFVIYNFVVLVFTVIIGASTENEDEDNYLRVIVTQELIAFIVITLLVVNLGGTK